MAETRRVVAYGRKKQNFITVKPSVLLPSPTSTPPRRKKEVIVIDDDSSYPPIEFIPEPTKLAKSSLKGTMGTARKHQTNKENVIQTGNMKPTSINNAAPGALQAKQFQTGRPTKATPRRSRGTAAHPTKGPTAARCPLGVKAAAQQIIAPAVKTIEIITLDSDGSEVRREERKPPPSIIDICSPGGSSGTSGEARRAKANLTAARNRAPQKRLPPKRIVSDESESEEESIVFSPRKKSAPRQRKLVVISDEEEDAPSPELESPVRRTSRLNLSPRGSSGVTQEPAPPKAERRTAPSSRAPVPRPSLRPRQNQSQSLHGGNDTRTRVSEAIASLPKDVIDSIARTGDISAALDHFTPRTRRHLEGGEEHEDDATVQRTSENTGASSSQQLERVTAGMGKLVLQKDPRSSQRSNPPPKEQKKSHLSPSLKSLLDTCGQSEILGFKTFISQFPHDPLHGRQAGQVSFRKLGEASYSEVFAIGEVVIKVVPLFSDDKDSTLCAQGSADTPCSSSASDVNQEIIITREIGELQSRFIRLLR